MPDDVSLESAGVRVVFRWEDDRWGHALVSPAGVLTAVIADDAATPVFNELHRQGDLVFLSGAADARHWSMSVEPAEDGGLVLDVACRMPTTTGPVAACYRGAGARLSPVDETTRAYHAGSEWRVEPSDALRDAPATTRFRYRATSA